MQIKRENYITILGWMANELGLKGNELLVYAIIYGFSQEEDNEFNGSLEYLASWTNTTRRGVLNVLKSLLDKKLIVKTEVFKGSVKFCSYKVNATNFHTVEKSSMENFSTSRRKNFNGTVEKSSHNIIDKLEDIIEELSLDEEWKLIINDWLIYKKEKKQSYKTEISLKTFVKKLLYLSNNNKSLAKEIIDNSIACNYSGIFAPRNTNNRIDNNSSNVQQNDKPKSRWSLLPEHLKCKKLYEMTEEETKEYYSIIG